jgi:hypothetical protein
LLGVNLMTLPIVGSRNTFATYGYRTAIEGGVVFKFSDFYTFLDAIGITSNHRAYVAANNGELNFRFPSVDTDLVELGTVTTDFFDGRSRARINRFGESPSAFIGVGGNIALLSHTKAIYLANNNSPGSPIGLGGRDNPNNAFFYAVGDSKGFAIFQAKYNGLNSFTGEWGFTYFGYCDNPASVAFFGNNQSYPLDYIAYSNSNVGTPFGTPNTPILWRNSKMANPGLWSAGPAINVGFITSINCATPTPNASSSNLIFRDDGTTDYGTNYPLGIARPFLLFTTQDLPINSLHRVEKVPPAEPTPEDHYHLVVDKNGFGSTLMPIITDGITMNP